MAEELPVLCKAFLICVGAAPSSTIADGLNLIGISDKVPIHRFPGKETLSFVVWLSRSAGVCDLSLQVYDDEESLISSGPVQHVEFGDSSERKPVSFSPGRITFNRPGAWEAVLLVNGQPFERLPFLVIQTETKDLT